MSIATIITAVDLSGLLLRLAADRQDWKLPTGLDAGGGVRRAP
jgi:hypothetical protein